MGADESLGLDQRKVQILGSRLIRAFSVLRCLSMLSRHTCDVPDHDSCSDLIGNRVVLPLSPAPAATSQRHDPGPSPAPRGPAAGRRRPVQVCRGVRCGWPSVQTRFQIALLKIKPQLLAVAAVGHALGPCGPAGAWIRAWAGALAGSLDQVPGGGSGGGPGWSHKKARLCSLALKDGPVAAPHAATAWGIRSGW